MALGFLPVPPAAATKQKPKLPVFKPHWWFVAGRIDARPVIWSLNNHPEEWTVSDTRPYYNFTHVPSGHSFKLSGYEMGLVDTTPRCSCQNEGTRKFQPFQETAVGYAAMRWERWKHPSPADDHVHFAAHFIHE